MKITITSGAYAWQAVIHDTPTGRLVQKTLPLKGRVSRWGEEIYFSIPVAVELEPEATEVVLAGDLGYWPTGRAFCIFFGPTPASNENEIRAASPVNVFGRLEGNLNDLGKVKDGDEVIIKKF